MNAETSSAYAWDVVVRDGSTLQLRAAGPDDRARIAELLEQLSTESLYLRFFTVPRLEAARAILLGPGDEANRFSLIGELKHRIVALAAYYRDPHAPQQAEVAFLIADALQGRGIGTRMLEQLAVVARERGIVRFEADALGE